MQGGTPHITRQGNTIAGTDCDDIIRGSNRGSNVIFTLAGNDIVYGGKNNDIIYAGSGDGDPNYMVDMVMTILAGTQFMDRPIVYSNGETSSQALCMIWLES